MVGTILLIVLLQTVAPPDDPASAELVKIVKADQDDRQFVLRGTGKPTDAQFKKMIERDKLRFKRTNEILDSAPALNPAGLDAAGLIMQHGTDPESYIRAHELSVCASLLGKASSLIAAAEDRYLVNVKRKQRFGSQFAGMGNDAKPNPTDEDKPTAVTDSLRRIYFEPPLQDAQTLGFLGAFNKAIKSMQETVAQRMDPSWIHAHSDHAISDELAGLGDSQDARTRVLELYNFDKLVSDDDFLNAGRVLASGSKPEELLLAHELVTVAMKEGSKAARSLFESTWDKFEVSIGHKPRYSAHREPKAVQAVLEGK